MAVANVNTVSGGSEGWAGGITTALYKELKGKRVRRGGVEQAAVGDQVGIPGHDQRYLTKRLHLTPRRGHRGWRLQVI